MVPPPIASTGHNTTILHWDFHATMRKDGSAVTTHGVETQIYRKENGV
jgi:hypothetical protein